MIEKTEDSSSARRVTESGVEMLERAKDLEERFERAIGRSKELEAELESAREEAALLRASLENFILSLAQATLAILRPREDGNSERD